MNPRPSPDARIRALEFLIESSHALNETLDLEALPGVVLKIVRRAVAAEAVSLLLVDDDGRHLVFELARGTSHAAVRGLKIPLSEGVAGAVARRKKPLIVDDVATDKRYSGMLEEQLGLEPHSVLGVPLFHRGVLLGVLEAVNRRDGKKFTRDDLEMATRLGEHISIAVANARLFRQAGRMSLEYTTLAEVSADVGKSLAVDEVLERILANLKKLIAFDAAAIFLLDREKETIVSMLHHGYPKGADEKIRVKIDEGVVGLSAREKKGIIVDDVRKQPVYVNARSRTRSEMVAPMLASGRVLGLFVLESDRVRAWRDDDLYLLQAFAAHAAVAVERAHLYAEQREKLEIQKELRLARTVQEFFTPRKSLVVGAYKMSGSNFSSLEVSGDYYDYFKVRGDLVAFAIADVAGKGVPASLIMSSFRATLHTVAPYLTSARQITLRANQILLETVRPEDFVTAFIGVLDPSTGVVTYCNAGHNPPVLMNPDGSYRFLESGGPILGVFEDPPMVEGRFRLGDEVLLCYTDGATEARNHDDVEFGEKRLVEAMREHLAQSPYRMSRAMYANLKRFLGDTRQGDDVTYLAVRRKPSS